MEGKKEDSETVKSHPLTIQASLFALITREYSWKDCGCATNTILKPSATEGSERDEGWKNAFVAETFHRNGDAVGWRKGKEEKTQTTIMIKGNILEQLWGWKTPACTASLLVNWLYYVTLLDDPEWSWGGGVGRSWEGRFSSWKLCHFGSFLQS
jgi:hypothetical protein